MKPSHAFAGLSLIAALALDNAELCAQGTDTTGAKAATWRCDGKPDKGTPFAFDTAAANKPMPRDPDGTLHARWSKGTTTYDIGYNQGYAVDSNQQRRQIHIYTLNKKECFTNGSTIDSLSEKTIVQEDPGLNLANLIEFSTHGQKNKRGPSEELPSVDSIFGDFKRAKSTFWQVFTSVSKKQLYAPPVFPKQ